MAPKAKGTQTGKKDFTGKEILIGDTLSDCNTKMTFRVNKYGQLESTIAPTVIKKEWQPNDYTVLIPAAENAKIDKAIKQAVKPAPKKQTIKDTDKGAKAENDKENGQEKTKAANNSFANIKDEDLTSELRRRGYKVVATKHIRL